MKLYFSAPLIGKYLPMIAKVCPWRLMSCHANYAHYLTTWMRATIEQGNNGQEVMLDSGAFTAWSKGEEVRLKHLIHVYRTFLHRYERHTRAVWLINLDRIPGRKGVEPTAQELVDAMRESDENFRVLQAEFGDRVLPVFHQGEPESRLYEVAAMAPYICVSPRNNVKEQSRIEWSRWTHARIKNLTHGLATTGVIMGTTVAWHSTDSAAWRIRAAMGMTFFNFGQRIASVFTSSQSPTVHTYDRHLDSMNPSKVRELEERANARGFTLDQLRHDVNARSAFSILELIDWNYGKSITPLNAPTLF